MGDYTRIVHEQRTYPMAWIFSSCSCWRGDDGDDDGGDDGGDGDGSIVDTKIPRSPVPPAAILYYHGFC